jgi:tetratricopeptide (TPR) repeat protein
MNNTRKIFDEALSALNNRDLSRAEERFRRVLRSDDAHIPALNLLTVILMSLGRFSEAEPFIAKAVKLSPRSDVSFYNYGLISKKLNKPREALEQFSKALELNPNVAETWNNRGTVRNDLKEYESAISDFDSAIELNQNYAEAYANKGKSLTRLRRYDEAFIAYDKALSLKPDLAEAWLGRGNVCCFLKRHDEAFAAYGKALSLKPDLGDAWLGRGNVFADLKCHDEAFAAYDKALSLKPDLADAWLGQGNVFADLKRHDEALVAYDKALSLKADLAEAWLGYGNVFTDLKRYDGALTAYDKSLSIDPDLAAVYTSRANILHILTRNNEALNSVNRAIELDPIDPQAHFNRSLILLTLGEYGVAWEEYEWRKKLPRPCANRAFTQTPLFNSESMTSTTVFIYGEQGLGDHIHFCRYVRLVADKGSKVILEAPKPLFQLFKSLDGISQLIEVGQSAPPFDYHCPLMSLPRAFRTTLQNVPNKVPYLFAEPNKVKEWANKLGAKSKLRIGLVWSGGFTPNRPEAWPANQRRNIPLAKFARLRDVDADFYSLQKGEPAVSELNELISNGWNGPTIIDWTDELNDFSDTAAFIENLDLVISVDTSTAHLAGAMAKPVWLLNRFDIEWRWLPNSPWYPTIRPYKQKEADNWDDIIENVKIDLIRSLHETNSPS